MQWVRAKFDSFYGGAITVAQDFMNSVVVKYNKIIGKDGAFNTSFTSVHDNIISMLANTITRKRKHDNDPADKEKHHLIPNLT